MQVYLTLAICIKVPKCWTVDNKILRPVALCHFSMHFSIDVNTYFKYLSIINIFKDM